MISKKMFRDELIAAGAERVSPAALTAFEEWMKKFMRDESIKAARRATADGRVTVERRDIGE
jgi:histone H3/H4